MGWDCSLVKSTIGEPSRSCHGEGHVRQSWFRIGCGGSLRGTETCTRARSDHGTRETRLPSLVSKDRSYKPMAKSSGGQRESEGVVVVVIGVKQRRWERRAPALITRAAKVSVRAWSAWSDPTTSAGSRPPTRPAKWCSWWPLAGTCENFNARYGHVPSGPRSVVFTRCMTGSGGVTSFGRRGGGCARTGERPASMR